MTMTHVPLCNCHAVPLPLPLRHCATVPVRRFGVVVCLVVSTLCCARITPQTLHHLENTPHATRYTLRMRTLHATRPTGYRLQATRYTLHATRYTPYWLQAASYGPHGAYAGTWHMGDGT